MTTVAPFLSQARSPMIRWCYDYWQSKRRNERLPDRNDIVPAEMKSFLHHVILMDVERLADRYRFRQRLVGTHIVELFGRDTTGEYVDQTSAPHHYAAVYARLANIVDTGHPSFGIFYPPTPHLYFLEYEHLTLPLASDGRSVDILFGVRCGLSKDG